MAEPVLHQQFKGHKDGITALHFDPTKKQLLSSSSDQTLMLWNFTQDSKVVLWILSLGFLAAWSKLDLTYFTMTR